MSINCVIINSSPLIVLLKSQQANLIPQLFTEVLVPLGVFEEVTTKDDIASTQLPSISWIKTVDVIAGGRRQEAEGRRQKAGGRR